jgi:catechol 2,3-dioxygenase-like lactoylglutathione lyase family enzyme
MIYDAIDSVYLAVPNLDAACRPYERLGLRLSPPRHGRRTLHVGGPTNLFLFNFLAEAGPDGPLAEPLRRACSTGQSLFAIGLGVPDLEAPLGPLERKGLAAARLRDGEDDLAWLPLHDRAGTDLILVRHARLLKERHAEAAEAGLLDHSFPLRRLDHVAPVAHDLEATTLFWADVLGVSVAGEVTTPTMVIRQLRFGDAVLELLGPGSPDSPLRQRPPGLVGMASWEVQDLERAVRQAREAGFTASDPTAGPLPGSRIATVPGAELASVNMQLLQYV